MISEVFQGEPNHYEPLTFTTNLDIIVVHWASRPDRSLKNRCCRPVSRKVNAMLTQKLYPVDMVVTHHEPHEDEMNANEQARLFGSELFPGTPRHPFALVDAGLDLDDGHDGDWLLNNRRRPCTGVKGAQFDEHAISKAARVRHSASTRMADFLGRRNDPGLEPSSGLSGYALIVTPEACRSSLNLIRAWWGAGVALYDGMALYRLAFRSLYRMFSGRLPVSEAQLGAFRWLIAEFFVEEFAPKDQKRKLLGTFKTGEDAAALFFKQIGDEVQPITTLDCLSRRRCQIRF